VGGFISIMIAVLIIVQAVIPTVTDAVTYAVDNGGVTGTTKTMIEMYPWFIAIAGLLFILGGVGLAK